MNNPQRYLLQCVLIFTTLLSSVFSMNSIASLPDFTELVEETSPSVVNIATIKHVNSNQYGAMAERYNLPQEVPEIFRHFLDQFDQGQRGRGPFNQGQPKAEKSSLGSGFIISADGYVLTNNHVIQGADEIIVRLSDRRELTATLVGADERADLALLKVNANGLPEVDLGDSDDLKVGEWVLAIGSPHRFE